MKAIELIDKLILIKDTLSSRYDRDVINEVCAELKELGEYRNTGLMPDEIILYAKCQAQHTSKKELQLGIKLEQLQNKINNGELIEVVRCKDCEYNKTCDAYENIKFCSCGRLEDKS